jgi:SRSO17 transposase
MGLMQDDDRPDVPPPSGTPPVLNLEPRDVADLVDEVAAYHQLFAPLFRRAEQRRWARAYLHGQLLDLERKSIEPLGLALPEGNVQALQQFISDGAWDDEAVLEQHQRLVADTLGDERTGILIIDGCEFPKRGRHSVGVARQYCGPVGQIANCQASVLACYVSSHGYTVIDRRLFLPEKWFSEEYRPLRETCGVPPDLSFQTHHALAAALIATLHERRALPFQWVTFDEDYGRATVLLDTVAELGLTYLAEVPRNTRVFPDLPRQELRPTPTGTAKLAWVWPTEPQRVDALVADLPETEWQRDVIKEGAKGPIVAEFAFRRVQAVRDEKPGPAVWLIARRAVATPSEVKIYLSNADADCPPSAFVWRSGMRWPIESAIEECKGVLGMDHYEVRGWVGWHHHLTLTLLAHHFLVRLQRRLAEKRGRC